MKPERIRVIAICLFRHDDAILVFDGFDAVRGSPYYRPLGGGLLPGETAAQALRREIREELGQEIASLRLLGVLENIFECDGLPGHEIVFVYDGRFVDTSLYARQTLTVYEDNGDVLRAAWRPMNSFDGYYRLVPEALAALILSPPAAN